ncbi:MAG: PEP/pyruvate-binding domain-containing protein [Deltaproteobacteria bacterium]|jgi:hypothetical protein|nr:PEP/pyruvate-binding domain-containing protein [Deltaproteobacteria bacterium]MBW2534159.1 PEP/pyruvate-binding domain-containing protein [Deltaproteobacteria bacterium]
MMDRKSAPSQLPYSPKVLAMHLALLQYPILGKEIRKRMREQLFTKGIISRSRFEQEVHDKAMQSQARELVQPAIEEPPQDWHERYTRTEEIQTEFYFATNFSYEDLQDIVEECLAGKGAPRGGILPDFNPEIAPWSMLFSQARRYEELPAEQRAEVAHHLREIIVVLTKGMLSDQLSFVAIAKEVLGIDDLDWVRHRRIGRGKIGGKAAGLVLAHKILTTEDPDDPPGLRETVVIPRSTFLGADMFYEFLHENELVELIGQKYRSYEDNVAEYPTVVERFLAGSFPGHHYKELSRLLEQVGDVPLIVRSSSLLEDNFGVAFAGKYDSVFCPNQGSRDQNLDDLCAAIKRVYASAWSPDALVYLQQRGLVDYDERMGALVQEVVGERLGDYYFPPIAGVGFSYNPVVWSPRIRRQDGFLRIVAGLGTRAVDRVDSDYARMVALSHPTLQPTKGVRETVMYSQRQLDVINLAENQVEALDSQKLLELDFPDVGAVGSILADDDLRPAWMSGPTTSGGQLVLTFAGLLNNRRFTSMMKAILAKLAKAYGRPVDIEFTVQIAPGTTTGLRIHVLQCRQQSRRANGDEDRAALPTEVGEDALLFESRRMVTNGAVRGIRYVVYVDPEEYPSVESDAERLQLARAIGQLNGQLSGHTFILIGPGRWGSSNRELGVPVSYGDIFNAKALIEVALPHGEHPPEASYGTHFFQDLIESDIYPVPIYPEEQDAQFDFDFFRSCHNVLGDVLPAAASFSQVLRVIDLESDRPGWRMEIVMNAQQERAVGFLAPL